MRKRSRDAGSTTLIAIISSRGFATWPRCWNGRRFSIDGIAGRNAVSPSVIITIADYSKPDITLHDFPRSRSDDRIPNPERSEEHTSELQSRFDLVCRLL